MIKLESVRESVRKWEDWRSDDFGHDCQKLLEAESDALTDACDIIWNACNEIESLREKLEIAVDALSFYMDEGNWFLSHEHVEKHYLEISDDDSRRMTDFYIGGKIARKALDKINNWDKTKESGQNETT